MKRVFIGSFIDQKISKKFYSKIKKDFAGVISGRWIPAENLHITYKFLGNVPENKVKDIKNVLSEILDKQINTKIILKGLSAFPNIENPKVFYISVEDKKGDLKEIYNFVEEKLENLEFEREKRSFTPHITLKRPKFVKIHQFEEKIKEYKYKEFAHIFNIEVNVIESILTNKGAIYRKI